MASIIPITNDYIVSSNYFYLIIAIYLHTIIWFQVTNINPEQTILMLYIDLRPGWAVKLGNV